MSEVASKTFEECAEDKTGTVYYDYYDDMVRIVIMRGPASVNCYLGVPLSHPIAGQDYDSLPVECHGGLTFSRAGKEGYLPTDMFWYGFDYAHGGDKSFYDLRPEMAKYNHSKDIAWTPEMIKKDIWSAVWSFQKLIKLAEAIRREP